MGMSIIANKYPHVYAAVVETVEAAGNAAAINNANVLTLGTMLFKVNYSTFSNCTL
jgi:ribose 5-phosphate isomerase RpiB